MRNGAWLYTTVVHDYPSEVNPFRVVHVKWSAPEFESVLYPFFYRTMQGDIIYPSEGEGWYWQPEIVAAKAAGVKFDMLESWEFRPAPASGHPFAFMPEIYAERKRRKQAGDASEKPMKLGINGSYGKLAQSMGWQEDRGVPPYHCLEWAGYITSVTRAAMYAAAMQIPQAVIMLATDGIYSTQPLTLDLGDGLGQWEAKTHDEIIVAQSGVYWVRDGVDWAEFRRGFDAGSITRDGVLRAWSAGQRNYRARSTRFVTLGSALSSDELWRCWRRWRSLPKLCRLDPTGTKRQQLDKWTKDDRPDARLFRTLAIANPTPHLLSAPYPLPWYPAETRWNVQKEDGVDEREYAAEQMEAEI